MSLHSNEPLRALGELLTGTSVAENARMPFEFLQGEISAVESAAGLTVLHLQERELFLARAEALGLQEGEAISVLLREGARAGTADVLALQRATGPIHYLGPQLRWGSISMTALLFALGMHWPVEWLRDVALIAFVLLLHHCELKRRLTLRAFRACLGTQSAVEGGRQKR